VKFLWVIVFVALFAGCDSTYRYIVFVPDRLEYVLVPDEELTAKYLDSSYIVSTDKNSVVYDRKDYKIEIKYMSDYQLNTFEFPEQSASGQFSTNPFTYGNWIDPELGYTPNRFTVFKVTIYNYAASKINLDPENCFLDTERGDKYFSYGREEKNSRYQSLEAYFKKRKGTSGIDDDVFESRMGIVRRTVHFLGKPIFRGDVRDGLIVFDPLAEDAGRVKLTIKDFILGYDENNQPSEFTTVQFYFKRVPFRVQNSLSNAKDTLRKKNNIQPLASDARPSGTVNIALRATNVAPVQQLMAPMETYFSETTNFKSSFTKTTFLPKELQSANVLMILTGDEEINFPPDHETAIADFIKKGGFIIADVFATSYQNKNWNNINNFLSNVGTLLQGRFDVRRIPSDHILFSIWKKFDVLPPIDIDLYSMQEKNNVGAKDRTYDYLLGLYFENNLIGVLSNRGYAVAWGEFYPKEFRIGKDYTRQRELLANIIYYALQMQKR
jgi:hypothetical protein